MVLEFADQSDTDSVYLENTVSSSHILDQQDGVAMHRQVFDSLAAAAPDSAPRKIAIGRDGETRQKNLEGCRLCKYPLADPDGVLLDLTD